MDSNNCKYCSKLTSNKSFCNRKCQGKWNTIHNIGKNNPNYGNKYSEETRTVISKKTKERMKESGGFWLGKKRDPTSVKKSAKGLKNHWKNHIHPMKGKTYKELYGKEKAEQLREQNRESTIKQLKEGNMLVADTKIERLVENELLFNDLLYIKQHPYKLGIADFWLPEINTIIMCDGDYWHHYPKGKPRDAKQVKYL